MVRRRNWLIGCLVAVIGVLVVGIGWASIPDAGGVFHGCVKADGTLVVKDDHGTGDITCGPLATKITWGQAGPQGPTGPSGISGYETVTSSIDITGPGVSWNTAAVCTAGKTVLSGGFVVNPGDLTNYYVIGSRPGPNHDNWNAAISYYGTIIGRLDVYAICAYVS